MTLVKRLALLALGLVAAVALIEVGLRVAGAFAPFGRARPPESGEHFVVLCVGDSHTWGMGEGYPARLAARLRARVPEARVVNLGVPGMNTAQLAARLAGWLDRYRANVVVVWSGANNVWNRSETERWEAAGVEPPGLARRLLDESKLLRLVRLTRDEQPRALELEELQQRDIAMQALRSASDVYVKPAEPRNVHGRVWRGLDGEDGFLNVEGEKLAYEEVERVTELDLRAMASMAAERGIPMLVITYPQDLPWWQAPSRGLARAAAAFGLTVVSGLDALEAARKVKDPGETLFDPSFHPARRLYDEIGDRVFAALESDGLLPGSAVRR